MYIYIHIYISYKEREREREREREKERERELLNIQNVTSTPESNGSMELPQGSDG